MSTRNIPEKMVEVVQRLGIRRDPCAACSMPVFLAEKLVIGRTIYHRICFRCARCGNQLTPGNYYETEDGEYCCETCPDEESTDAAESYIDSLASNENTVDINHTPISNYQRALSDEEKRVQQKNCHVDDTSASKSMSEIAQMRLNFMSSHLLEDETNVGASTDQSKNRTVSPDENCVNVEEVSESKSMTTLNDNDNCSNKFVYNIGDSTENSIYTRCLTATNRNIDFKNDSKGSQDTKETLGVVNNTDDVNIKAPETEGNVDQCLPLVKRRLEMFENLVISKSGNELKGRLSSCIEPDSLEVTTCTHQSNEKISSVALEREDDVKLVEDTSEGINILPATEIDLSVEETNKYPDTMNPFGSEEDLRDEEPAKLESSTKKVSTNPFGSDSSEDEDDNEENNSKMVPPKPAARINRNYDVQSDGSKVEQSPKRRLVAPHINLNPFWSDDEEPESDDEVVNKNASITTPIPKPRTTKSTLENIPYLKSDLQKNESIYASNSSIASSSSTATSGGHYRKRRPAPPPPIARDKSSTIVTSSPDVKSTLSLHESPIHATPKQRKSKRAPPPPTPINTSQNLSVISNLSLNESPIKQTEKIIDDEKNKIWDDTKVNKNEANRSKQSISAISPEEDQDFSFLDKSVQGKWKRKKAPAPALPIPQRRKIKVMSAKDVKFELSEIEMQQQGLEKQGVRLEQLIREKCESGTQDNESSLSMDADELVLELFALVNEKNELFRRQAELMLLKRQQRLEEEHADVEYQIRCLMCQPEATKTDFDKQREEALIQRLVEIVERRSEIVECLEMDRRREIEEDKSISMHMEIYTAKNKGGERLSNSNPSIHSVKSKKTKFKEKLKEKHYKRSNKKDADKDVDETEVKLKHQIKKKWF